MKFSVLRRQYFNPATTPEDLSAGLVLGIQSIPDGLATGLLVLTLFNFSYEGRIKKSVATP
jgi:hypothetical protein